MTEKLSMKEIQAKLITRYKEYVESKLAIGILERNALIPVIGKVSLLIREYLNKNKDSVIKEIQSNPKISDELYGKRYFGRLNNN